MTARHDLGPAAIGRKRRDAMPASAAATRQRERRLEGLMRRLPRRLRRTVRWLRRPSSRWLRIPAGILLIGGSLLSLLPFFGLWMLPLGLILLAEDIAPLRRARDRLLDRIERRRPHWLHGRERQERKASAVQRGGSPRNPALSAPDPSAAAGCRGEGAGRETPRGQ